MPRPSIHDYPVFFDRYIQQVEGSDIKEIIHKYSAPLQKFVQNIPDERSQFAYAEGKWTTKEVIQHLCEVEWVMSYRALRISRKDKTPLPSFDENMFIQNSYVADRSLHVLKEEFCTLRKATDLLAMSFNDSQLKEQGVVGGKLITVNALVFIIFGHQLHHQSILKEKYLV